MISICTMYYKKEIVMKKTTRLLAVLMTLAMVLAALASCTAADPAETSAGDTSPSETSGTNTPANTTGSGDFSGTPTTPTTPESTPATSQDLTALIPPAMNLDRTMSIFAGTLYYDEWLLEDDGDLVGTEVYNRIPRVEANLGIEIDLTTIKGDWGERQTIMDEVSKRQESTDPNMIADLCSTYSYFAGSLTVEGRYQNIASSDNIDLTNPWWPADLLSNSTIDDKVYFVSGDISPTLLYETYAIFFNRTLLNKYNLDNPIDLVNNYEWTLDKVIEMTTGIYEDLDEVSGPSAGDFFAFNFNDDAHLKAFPFAMGVRVLLPDEDSGYAYAESYTGQKMEDINDKVNAWIGNNQGVKSYKESGFGDYGVTFKQETNIFTVGNFAYASQYIAGLGIDYAVVPCPMYDEEQEQYFSYYGNPTSFWGIPTNAYVDDSAALLESLAADAYVYISPALFERALKVKYVTNEVDGISKMFDIIRDGLVFDACMMYGSHISGYNGFTSIGSGLSSSWISQFNNFTTKGMNNKLKSLVDSLRALPQ